MSTPININLQRILHRSPVSAARHQESSSSSSAAISQANAPATVPSNLTSAAVVTGANPVQDGSVNLTQIFLELKSLKDEFRKGLSRVQDEQRKMGNALVKALEAAFTIESSPYKEALSIEMGVLYCTNLKRKPSIAEIAEKIVSVLGPLAACDAKLQKAKAFCSNRLTEIRSEERRRLFGGDPCSHYAQLRTEEFAEKFMKGLKVPIDVKDIYVKNLALLRLFARSTRDADTNTFREFRKWIKSTFSDDPSTEDMEAIIRADIEFDYCSCQPIVRRQPHAGIPSENPHTPSNAFASPL